LVNKKWNNNKHLAHKESGMIRIKQQISKLKIKRSQKIGEKHGNNCLRKMIRQLLITLNLEHIKSNVLNIFMLLLNAIQKKLQIKFISNVMEINSKTQTYNST
jgi:hypothetical protein